MCESPDDGEIDGFEDHIKWAVLVDLNDGSWLISRVTPGSEIGDQEEDRSRPNKDWRIGAFFDQNVEEILKAMVSISGGGLEGCQRIQDLLFGTCRSFLEAQANLKKWKS